MRAMAKENGIQSDFVDMYLQGEIPALCDQLTAALGKIDVEVAELKPKEIMEDWVEYLRGQCMENELLAFNVRKKGKSLKGCIAALLMWSFKNQQTVDKDIIKAAGDPGHGQSKADHHGLLHGKVGGTDEKESD